MGIAVAVPDGRGASLPTVAGARHPEGVRLGGRRLVIDLRQAVDDRAFRALVAVAMLGQVPQRLADLQPLRHSPLPDRATLEAQLLYLCTRPPAVPPQATHAPPPP